MKKLARIVVKPRDRGALTLSIADARAFIAKGFGGIALDVSDVRVDDDAWRANAILDVYDAALVKNPADERLWRAFVEAAFTAGSCTVVEIGAR